MRIFLIALAVFLLQAVSASESPEAKPVKIGTVDELSEPWSYKEFMFGAGYSRIPGIIVRLPDETAQTKNQGNPYLVVSRICPQDGCVLKFEAPIFRCPCDQTIFTLDPMEIKELNFKLEAGDIVITGQRN